MNKQFPQCTFDLGIGPLFNFRIDRGTEELLQFYFIRLNGIYFDGNSLYSLFRTQLGAETVCLAHLNMSPWL